MPHENSFRSFQLPGRWLSRTQTELSTHPAPLLVLFFLKPIGLYRPHFIFTHISRYDSELRTLENCSKPRPEAFVQLCRRPSLPFDPGGFVHPFRFGCAIAQLFFGEHLDIRRMTGTPLWRFRRVRLGLARGADTRFPCEFSW